MKIWECKIGEVESALLPPGSDGPMRDAVEMAYQKLVGRPATFAFTGWGGRLTESERAVVEDREPDPSSFVPEVEPVLIGDCKLYMHVCGHVEWLSDSQRAEMVETGAGGGCDACESGSVDPLDWSLLYQSAIR